MKRDTITRTAAIGAILALGAAPAALAAKPDDPGSQGQGHGKAKGKGATKGVTYVFKGVYDGNSGVAVDHGNAHVKRAELIGEPVSFDLTTAKLSVADTNGNGADLTDVAQGDRVVVKARLPRKEPGTQPFVARQLVDQTHPAVAESDAD